jgi:hypothetical protein
VGWSQLPCSSSAIIILLTMLYTAFSSISNMVHSWSRDRLRYWALREKKQQHSSRAQKG